MKIKILLLTLLCLLCNSIVNAQKISKRFVSKNTETGIIYFIKPYEMPYHGSNRVVAKPMLYDLTIITNSDSVAFCTSIFTKEPVSLENAQITISDGTTYTLPLQKIVVGMEKKHYKNRYRFYITKKQLDAMYGGAKPFDVNFGNGIVFSIAKGSWAAESQTYKTILNLSTINEQIQSTQ